MSIIESMCEWYDGKSHKCKAYNEDCLLVPHEKCIKFGNKIKENTYDRTRIYIYFTY